jgi:hypothetical protein
MLKWFKKLKLKEETKDIRFLIYDFRFLKF